MGASPDGKKRLYYVKLRIPRRLLLAYLYYRRFVQKHRVWSRVIAIALVLVILAGVVAQTYEPKQQQVAYDISGAVSDLIHEPIEQYAAKLVTDPKTGTIQYNNGYSPAAETSGDSSGPKITAEFAGGTTNAITVTDPVNSVSLTLTPKFAVASPQKNINRVVYPLIGRNASAIYSLGSSGIKEDFILRTPSDDSLSFAYDIGLSDSMEARIEKDGSVGVYGVAGSLLGNVTTATDKDAQLLATARKNSAKTNLIFRIPAPFVLDGRTSVSDVAKASFSIKGKVLTVHATHLLKAKYPLSIDPSIYVETAAKLMRGNNETNVDFDTTNELIQKSQTTGARIDQWSSTNNLTYPTWGQGTAVAGGYIYSVGGGQGSATTTSTYYANGSSTYLVPTGVTSVVVKTWGAGGGGGAGSGSSGVGGNGGGAGYSKGVVTVTPGESLDVLVGAAGAAAGANLGGGGGGGFSSLSRSGTYLMQAGGGGGGGGSRGNATGNGGTGGAGGGASGVAGTAGGGTSPTGGGGGLGSGTAGSAGTTGTGGTAGSVGAANAGGNGAGYASNNCNTAVTNTQGSGVGNGGNGGSDTTGCSNGGGGGGGRFGGGGGGSTTSNNRGGGGGGGGSSLATGASQVQTTGSLQVPGNSGDSDRGGSAGNGGTGGTNVGATTAGNDGAVVISYTSTGPAAVSTVLWSKFNSNTKSIDSPNPGNGVCSGWCTSSSYNLPVALTNLSLVAYNGFLYAIGGNNIGGTPVTSVYIAKLGANGEPSLWHPSGGTPVFWYTSAALPAARSKLAAVAYNNRIYVLGGLTTSSTLLTSNTVLSASVNPTGDLSAWSATGMQAITGGTGRYGMSVQQYNGVLYIIGGDASFTGAPLSTVEYSKLNSDGSMNAWTTTTSLITSGRMTVGGSFSTIWGAYIYIGGGCTTVNGSGFCTAIASDMQLASINADGTLSEFNTIIGLTNQRIGHTLIAWQNGLYRLGGCRTQDPSTGICSDTIFDVDYGVINQDGDASTVANSVTSGTAPCSGLNPISCNLPSASVGNVLNESVITNGYLYVMGGCTSNDCTAVSTGALYTSIGSDGSLTKPATCVGSYSDSWCVSSSNMPVATAAGATTVFNGVIYVIGGFNNQANIYYVTANNDGSLGTWSGAVSLTSIGAIGVTYAYAYSRANPSSAGSVPGNLYILGGCTDGSVGCSNYTDAVYKCSLNTAGAPSACTKTGQLQIGTLPPQSGGTPTSAGLGAMAGAVYANYIYLVGGLTPGATDLTTARYAKFDNNNNIVAVSGSAWVEGPNQTVTGRRRGAGFGYNGYLYVVGGYDGSSGVLADIEFAKLNVSDGSWGTFAVSSVTINQRWGLTVPVSNSFAYVIGGCTVGAAPSACSTRTYTIQTFQIYNNDSGAIKNNTAGNQPGGGVDSIGGSSTILNGYIYNTRGCSTINCSTVTATTYYAAIDANGVVGTWSTGGSLPAALAWGKLLTAGGTIYYVGGQTTSALTSAVGTIYYTSGISSGNPTWNGSAATKGVGDTGGGAQARTQFGATMWNNRIYITGGYDASSAVQNTVYGSADLTAGSDITSNWTSTVAFNVARAGTTAISYANNLYILGGVDTGGNYLNDVQFTQINGDGTVDAWTYTSSLDDGIRDADGFAANGYMYLVGGRTAASTCVPNTAIAPVSANTTIATGNNPTGVGAWFETNVRYTGDRYGASAEFSQGRLYLIGGGCTGFVGSGDRMYYSTLKSQPQVAQYSRMIDTDTDVFPTGWLMNGVDNSTGARWQARYKSMHDNNPLVVGGSDSTKYSGGTISQSGTTTVTGTTTNFTASMVGATLQYADLTTAIISSVNVGLQTMVVSVSKTVTGQNYTIYQLQENPNEDCGTSSTMAPMTTWGQETNFGNVGLGTVNTYTPLNGTGGNINCARYFYFYVTIDASQTFGYPEDVSRGPTIADLSLFFTSDPSKRLRHGKTFTGGELQPLDTPCRVSGANPAGSQPNCPLP